MLQSNVDLFSLVWKEKCPSWLYIAPLSSPLLAFSSSFFSRLPFQTWWLDYNDHFQCERHGDYRWWRLLEKQIFFIFLRCLPFICNNGVWNKKPAISLKNVGNNLFLKSDKTEKPTQYLVEWLINIRDWRLKKNKLGTFSD